MVAVAGAGDRLDRQANQDVSDVAVPTPRARREHRWFVDELRQPVPGLEHRVARPVSPQGLEVLAGFLVSVISDAGRVGQQLTYGHRRRDRRAGQVDDLDDRGVQTQTPLIDQLQRCHRREQLRDRRRVEPGSQETGTAHRRDAQPYAPVNSVVSPRRTSTTPENRSSAARDRSHPSSPTKDMTKA